MVHSAPLGPYASSQCDFSLQINGDRRVTETQVEIELLQIGHIGRWPSTSRSGRSSRDRAACRRLPVSRDRVQVKD